MSQPSPAAGAPRLLWVNAALAIVAVASLLVLLAAVVFGSGGGLSGDGGKDNAQGREYDAVRSAATEESLAFMTVDYQKMDELTKRVLDGATGEFAKEYKSSIPQLQSAVESQQSTSSGRVLSVGVSSLDNDSATVFVAADSEVSNKGTKGKKVPRYYRLQMDMTKVKDRWLVSKLQFVG